MTTLVLHCGDIILCEENEKACIYCICFHREESVSVGMFRQKTNSRDHKHPNYCEFLKVSDSPFLHTLSSYYRPTNITVLVLRLRFSPLIFAHPTMVAQCGIGRCDKNDFAPANPENMALV